MLVATPTREHLAFIPKIYDTITEPDKWAAILDEFTYLCGADAAGLMMGDNVCPEISKQILTSNLPAGQMEEYGRLHHAEEAKAYDNLSSVSIHTWVSDEDAFGMKADEIPSTLWQRENWGFDRRMGTRLNDTRIWFDGINLNYKIGRDLMLPAQESVSQLFLPHLAKTVELSRPFLLLKDRFNAILSVLDYLQIGIAITNRPGEVIASNLEAKRVFDTRNGISLSLAQKIQLGKSDKQGQLLSQIEAAVDTTDPKNFEAVISCAKRDGVLPWLLEVFPLGNLDGSIDRLFKGAAIFMTDPERRDIISTKGMQALFQLTDAESDVCALLAAGHRVEDIADSRNSTPGTVKGQIQNLFMKTETNSQADLVRLALKVNLPVARKEG